MKHILLVEDEEALAEAIILNLELEGYKTTWVKNGTTAVQKATSTTKNFDLIVLDVMIPEKDGLEVSLLIRKAEIQTPILFLSARNSTNDKIQGLKAGGNDYLGKPFHLEEFILRVKNLLSIHQPKSESVFSFGNCSLNFDAFTGTNGQGDSMDFSKREIGILKLFSANPNKALSREELADDISNNGEINFRVIDNALVKFRKFFETDSSKPQHFISVRGVGYLFKP